MAAGHGFVLYFLHPLSSDTLSYVAPSEGKVDLGTIARRFHLDPTTIRFNGHFISRNADFISSLTWRQVVSFFESRGFSSGRDYKDPVQVEGSMLIQSCNKGANLGATSEEARSKHRDSQGLKRTSGQADISPSTSLEKRLRQDSCSDIRSTTSEAMRLKQKVKRGRQEDVSAPATWSKRIRQDGNSDIGLGSTEENSQKNNYRSGSKRHMREDEISTYRSLWERVKEIRV